MLACVSESRCPCSFSCVCLFCVCFFCMHKTPYDMRISDWSSDVCSSDLFPPFLFPFLFSIVLLLFSTIVSPVLLSLIPPSVILLLIFPLFPLLFLLGVPSLARSARVQWTAVLFEGVIGSSPVLQGAPTGR